MPTGGVSSSPGSPPVGARGASRTGASRRASFAVGVAFFLSGATALAAEVVLNRLLRDVFGSSHTATATVLAAYMCGLSIGALLLGGIADRIRRPLAAYAILELLVGLYLVLLPTLFEAFRGGALEAARAVVDVPGGVTTARFALSFLFVLLPSALMGGTLPVLIAAYRGSEALPRRLPWLYAVNTMGAATGTLITAYWGIEMLGLDGVASACALIDVGIAVVAFGLSGGQAPQPQAPEEAEAAPAAASDFALPEQTALGLAFGQGVASFSLEVVWAHMLGTVIGVTVYAFAVMLAVILLGLGAGSLVAELGRRRIARSPTLAIAWSQAGLGLAVALTLFLWDRFPLVVTYTRELRPDWSFAEREIVRFAFAVLLLLPASMTLGFALPVLATTRDSRSASRGAAAWVGRLFAANTLGAICGALGTGFLLLGNIGSLRIFQLVVALATGLCVITLLRARDCGEAGRRQSRRPAALGVGALVLALAFSGWNRERLTAGSHYYWSAWEGPAEDWRLTWFSEDAQSGFVTVAENQDGIQVMSTNGKYEGSDQPFEFQDALALIGAPFVAGWERALLVGLGPGRTLALMAEMPFQSLEVVDFSPAVIRAARERFSGLVGPALADERVRVFVDDGRSHIQLSPHRYDLVVVGITGAAFAGSGHVYSQEFFVAVKERLAPGGIFMLWLQTHHVRVVDAQSVIFTLRSVFPHVQVYSTPRSEQGYLLASVSPLTADPLQAERLGQLPLTRKRLDALGMRSTLDMTSWAVLIGDGDIERFTGERPALLTDMRPYFEYGTPRGLAKDIRFINMRPFSSQRLPSFDPELAEGVEAGLKGLQRALFGDAVGAVESLERSEELLGEQLWPEPLARLRGHLGR